jgi:tetratricopeptide (TPR) repeat protein
MMVSCASTCRRVLAGGLFAAVVMLADVALAQNDAGLCRTGSGERALAACNRAIARSPRDATLYLGRGLQWIQAKNYDRAIADLTQGIRLAPERIANAYGIRGAAWKSKGELDKAIADFSEAVRIDPKYTFGYHNRGKAWSDKGDYDRAIADFSAAIRLDPQHASAYFGRASAWSEKGEHDKAIADYSEAIRINSKDEDAYYNRGLELEKKQRLSEALNDFLRYSELAPSEPDGAAAVKRLTAAVAAAGEAAATSSAAAATAAAPPPVISSSAPGRRVALVIGNAAYQHAPALQNPGNDARLLAATLREAGFASVTIKSDLTREQTILALREFARETDTAEWAAVYYSGHGIELGGTNYLIPVDAQLKADRDVDLEAVDVGKIVNAIEGAKRLRLVILDACRDNPFANQMRRTMATRSVGRGLARIEPEAGTLIVYAAKHGETALDGDGRNSPFVQALVNRIQQRPPIELRRLFDFVRDDVLTSTQKRQQPFSYGSLSASEDFYFAR